MSGTTKHTSFEYIKRANTVLDFIEKNLEAHLSLEILSQKAHYSPFHFHRVFATITNENLTEYVNRKRLERIAAILLVGPHTPLKVLAYKYGFNSESAFSRAFKKHYGITPTHFKSEGSSKLSKIGIAPFNTEKYICDIKNLRKWTTMNAQITLEEIKEIQLAAIGGIGKFEEMGNMFKKLMEWGHKNDLLLSSNFKALTVYHDNPHVTDMAKVRYSTAVTITKNFKAEEAIRPLTIQSGHYAVGHFEISSNAFPKAWKSMSLWVIENGYQFRDAEYFEVYLNDYKTHPKQKHIINIYVPVENERKGKPKTSNNQNLVSEQQPKYEYFQLIDFMKDIRAFFFKNHGLDFKLGSIYRGHKDFSYFSLTTESLKAQKLKFVLIFNHKMLNFKICLSGQNKSIRKKYWTIFKESDWNTYDLVQSIDDSLSIIDYTMIEKPDFDKMNVLKNEIETHSFKFMNEIRDILE